ncbi:MAG: YibE/F family protein [Sedimentibacter sp.]|uniref:YibE/F family protein n=1 Tax=Sedimentibacter sp. TaxID=1960295 RepID=UPI002980ACAB|nr:YibE/F family protein [Sedimentibacter sp.]MDW5299191.1 YibE/F family protein [Sedimentibacter sp.]
MLKNILFTNKKELIFIAVFFLFIFILAIIPTGFEKQIYVNSEGVRAKVISVDNSGMYKTGMITQGGQNCEIEIETGSHKGENVKGVNLFVGKYEFDKIFKEGDKSWVLLEFDSEGNIIFANMIDYYRIDKQIFLIGLFVLTIIIFSGFTGVRTLLSFSFAVLSIWKILIPLMLKGYNPLFVGLIVGNALTVTTLLLVAGFTKKAYAAIISSIGCSLITAFIAVIFTRYFNIDGTVMQWSESLLYAGFMSLDLTSIFEAGVYLACSGAILDLAIDISASLEEIIKNNPGITKKNLIKSGLTIGKSVVGSQTTTLLLAYMGSYISVMMVYMAQGTPMMNILNSKAISAEILHTFVGCLGLVLVSPLTSLICGFMYYKNKFTEKFL